MGLDSFLTKKYYCKNWGQQDPKEKHNIVIKKGDQEIKIDNISYIESDVFYWRKSNHIHKYFVDNCQDGIDDCRISYVEHEVLEELLDICKKIEENKSLAESLLPTQEGFFFGNTEYDEYYYESITKTRKMLEKLDFKNTKEQYYYNSSW
jgi:hypothetical protein